MCVDASDKSQLPISFLNDDTMIKDGSYYRDVNFGAMSHSDFNKFLKMNITFGEIFTENYFLYECPRVHSRFVCPTFYHKRNYPSASAREAICKGKMLVVSPKVALPSHLKTHYSTHVVDGVIILDDSSPETSPSLSKGLNYDDYDNDYLDNNNDNDNKYPDNHNDNANNQHTSNRYIKITSTMMMTMTMMTTMMMRLTLSDPAGECVPNLMHMRMTPKMKSLSHAKDLLQSGRRKRPHLCPVCLLSPTRMSKRRILINSSSLLIRSFLVLETHVIFVPLHCHQIAITFLVLAPLHLLFQLFNHLLLALSHLNWSHH